MRREQFLGRVSSALRGAELPDVSGPAHAPEIIFADPVARFVAQAESVAADVVRVTGGLGALAAVGTTFGGERDYIAWDGLEEIVPGWDRWVSESGRNRVDADVRDRAADHERVGAVTIGVTTADVAIAASGSVVLAHGPGRPRSASLLVERHIVLLPIDRIVHSLSEALDRVGWDDNSNIAVITGPSRTGDIESILTLGVHGPRHLQIVLIG